MIIIKNSILHRKDRLVISAIEIIDELGIQGLSTREIAKRQDISDATLFRHYKSKNDLLNAILEFFTKFDEDIFQTALIKNLRPFDAIIFILGSVAEYYENYPAITAVMQMFDVFRYEPELSDKVKEIFDRRLQMMVQFIDDAKKAGELKHDIDSEAAALLIAGSFREICLKWRLHDKNFALKDKVINTISAFLQCISLS